MASATKRVDIGLFGQDRDLKATIERAKADMETLRAKAKNIALTADDRDLQLKAKAAALTLDKLGRTIARPNIKLEGVDTAILKAELLDHTLMKSATDTLPIAEKGVAGLSEDLSSMSQYALPAAIGGLVALSGQALVVGTGLGGVALAALGVIKNQKLMAQTLGPLKADYNAFTKALQPEVLSIFSKGIKAADNLLTDIEPVSKAAGKALGGVMDQVDKEFQSGTWQQFFGYMEKNAAPDVAQLGNLFTDLLGAIPPVAEALHPLGKALLEDADDAAKLLGVLGGIVDKTEALAAKGENVAKNVHGTGGTSWLSSIGSTIASSIKTLPLVGPIVSMAGGLNKLSQSQAQTSTAAQKAALAIMKEQESMDSLAASISNATTKLLTLQGDDISWHQAMNDATAALKQNKDALSGNSDAALADKQALLTATNAAIKHAQSQVQLGHDVTGADKTLNSQIAYLAEHASKSKFAQQEIQALITAENHIPGHITSAIKVNSAAAAAAIANIENRLARLNGQTSTVYVDYSVGGQSYVVPHHRKAAGGLIPGSGNFDSYPALLTPGEAVVPKRLVPSVAPFLKAQGVPGFNMGGVPDFGPLAGGTTTIRLEWAGGGSSDREFMSWLSKNIRVSGGDPGILQSKR